MFSMLKMTLCAAAVAVLGFMSNAAGAQEVRITGSGATFPAPLYNKWIEEYGKTNPSVKLDYGGGGSGKGIADITARITQFGASDAPMTEAQEKAAPARLLHLPTVAGPVVMIYNIKGVNNLKLNGDVLGGIYLKTITKWNDPKITALNAGALPDATINVVHRSDGSGTSYIFTDYLSKVSKKWNDDIGANVSPDWPTGIGGKGSDGVTAAVQNSEGSVGYVEVAYATKNKLTYAAQVNAAGKDVQPTIAAVNAAAKGATFPENMKVSITDSKDAAAYPVCGFTYILIYDDLSYMKDKALATETVKFILWAETGGQKFAGDLGYAELPKDAQDKVVARLKAIKFDGQPLLK